MEKEDYRKTNSDLKVGEIAPQSTVFPSSPNPRHKSEGFGDEEDKLMTGSFDLNKWLDGGYEKGIITLLYGPAASGKSNFVTLAACHNAKKDKKIVFIDTEGSLSLDRVKQISGGIPEHVLKNIVILKPINFEEQKEAFEKLLNEYKSKNIGLIIVDSMVMYYRLELAEARKNGIEAIRKLNHELNDQVKALYEIARKSNIPILITSQVYNEYLSEEDWLSGKEPGVSIVGGEILKYWSKCIIELSCKNGMKKAIIKKHRSLAESEFNFDVCDEGIKKRGWV